MKRRKTIKHELVISIGCIASYLLYELAALCCTYIGATVVTVKLCPQEKNVFAVVKLHGW